MNKNINDFKKISLSVKVIIRGLFFFIFPAAYSSAFSGAKYAVSRISLGKPIELNPFVMILIGLLAFTILFGRYFCGFACAFGTYGDVLYEISARIRKKFKKRPFALSVKSGLWLKYGKYICAVILLALCYLGKESIIGQISPWTAFSRLEALSLPDRSNIIGVLIFAVLSILMLFEKRFFCRFLCPMGALFAIMPVIPPSQLGRNRSRCFGKCKQCINVCPANITITDTTLDEGGEANASEIPIQVGDSSMGECFACGKCVEACPANNIKSNTILKEYKGLIWIAAKGVMLAVLLYFLLLKQS